MFIMWLHLVAAITWIGGMLFVWLVLRPVFSTPSSGTENPGTLQRVEERFKTVRWVSLLTLLATGIYNLIQEGGSARLESGWGGILMIKLLLVAIVVGLSGMNDFLLSASAAGQATSSQSIRPKDLLNGLILALGLLIVFIAVYLEGA